MDAIAASKIARIGTLARRAGHPPCRQLCVALVLAQHFLNLKSLEAANEEELSAVHEIGDVIAKSVFDFLPQPLRVCDAIHQL